MLDNILGLVKEVASDAINKSTDIPSDKKELAITTTAETITSGLTKNLSSLTGLLGAGKSEVSSNPIVDMIQKSVVNSLAEKVGISPTIAGALASSIVPTIMSRMQGKVETGKKGFSIDSVTSALGGLADSAKKEGGGLLSSISKLFS